MFSDDQQIIKVSIVLGLALTILVFVLYLPSFSFQDNNIQPQELYKNWQLEAVYKNGLKVVDTRNTSQSLFVHKDSTATTTIRDVQYPTILYIDSIQNKLITGQDTKLKTYDLYNLTQTNLEFGVHHAETRELYIYTALKK
jgi:hypothetical protein